MDSANVFSSLLSSNSDHVMIHLRGSGYTQLIALAYIQTEQLQPPNKSSHDLNWVATRV